MARRHRGPTAAEKQAEFRRRQRVALLDEDWVRGDFAKRRKVAWWATGVLAAVIGACWLLKSRQVIDEIDLAICVFVSIPIYILAIGFYYRCPQCDSLPMAGESYLGPTSIGRRSYLDLNPAECRKCGAKLR